MIDRFNISGFHTLVNTNDGHLVRYSDYEALEAKLAALVEATDAIYKDACTQGGKSPVALWAALEKAIAAAKVSP